MKKIVILTFLVTLSASRLIAQEEHTRTPEEQKALYCKQLRQASFIAAAAGPVLRGVLLPSFDHRLLSGNQKLLSHALTESPVALMIASRWIDTEEALLKVNHDHWFSHWLKTVGIQVLATVVTSKVTGKPLPQPHLD